MNKVEFIKKINEINLGNRAVIREDNYTGAPNIVGCFKRNDEWVVYENNERGMHEDILVTADENEAFKLMYDYIVGMSLI